MAADGRHPWDPSPPRGAADRPRIAAMARAGGEQASHGSGGAGGGAHAADRTPSSSSTFSRGGGGGDTWALGRKGVDSGRDLGAAEAGLLLPRSSTGGGSSGSIGGRSSWASAGSGSSRGSSGISAAAFLPRSVLSSLTAAFLRPWRNSSSGASASPRFANRRGAPPPPHTAAASTNDAGSSWRPDRFHALLALLLLLAGGHYAIIWTALPPLQQGQQGAFSHRSDADSTITAAAAARAAGAPAWAVAAAVKGHSSPLRHPIYWGQHHHPHNQLQQYQQSPAELLLLTYLPDTGSSTLVIYVFAGSDPEARPNLEHFISEGIVRGNAELANGAKGDGADYLILLQHDEGTTNSAGRLPELPPNARFVYHNNECYDWGSSGWLLRQEPMRAMRSRYRHFVFLNSSVRGPFMPAYLWGVVHWAQALVGMLSGPVKLAGASINCEGAGEADPFAGLADAPPTRGGVPGPWVPHVQSYAIVTDAEGLRILESNSSAFRCHRGRLDAIRSAEVGASAAMLAAGHELAALQLKYAPSIRWGGMEAWGCNEKVNPTLGDTHYDGGSLDPLEAMFVKIKANQRGNAAARKARAYGRWRREADAPGLERDVCGNTAFLDAEEMGQEYMQRVLEALHSSNGSGGGVEGSGEGSGVGEGTSKQQVAFARVAEAPDNGQGLAPDMAQLYAAYVGQFV